MTNFLFSHSVSVPQKDETFEVPQRSMKVKIMSFFISINCFMMLWTGRVNKAFSPTIFINISKMLTNMKLAFTNVPFKHNSACVMIKKWLRFKSHHSQISIYLTNISNLKQRSKKDYS